jgi:hypothetical protein
MSNDVQDRLRVQLDAAHREAPAEPALSAVLDQCGRDLVRHRRRLVGAAVAAGVALAFTIPALAGGALRPDIGPDPTTSRVASDGASATPTPAPTPDPTPSSVVFSVPATEFPATVGEILKLTDVSPALRDLPDEVQDTDDIKSARFRVDGMLVQVIVLSGEVGEDAPVGNGSTSMKWSPSDGVLARTASVRRNGYAISVVAYNTAETANSPALAAEPVLSESQILKVVSSDLWFEGRG